MAADKGGAGKSSRFGSCCENLREVLDPPDFEPLITEGDDGVLYMTVGNVALEDDSDEVGLVDHPLYFCPFCGTRLQTADEVEAKAGSD